MRYDLIFEEKKKTKNYDEKLFEDIDVVFISWLKFCQRRKCSCNLLQ